MSKKAKDISINFTFHDDSVVTVQGAEGDSLLDLVVDNDIGEQPGGIEGDRVRRVGEGKTGVALGKGR